MKKIRLGVVCLARTTYEYKTAESMYLDIISELKKIPEIEYTFIENTVIEVEEAIEASKFLLSKDIDGLIIISGTFHLGHLALVFNKYIKKPFLLWAPNELPYDGGKIRLNSVCGLNLNASNLYKSGKDDYDFIVGDSVDMDWINAVRIKSAIENARVGIVGYRAHGFFNVGTNDLDIYSKMGILIDHYEIGDMYNQEVDDTEISEAIEEIKKLFICKELNDYQVTQVAKLLVSAEKFIVSNNLDVVAVRCWPEFARDFGVSPCAAMSILQSKGYILACEGDVEGGVSMLAGSAIGTESPYLADLSQLNFNENFALMWHCGVAPADLWDKESERSLDTYFAGGKGVTAGFVMKPGKINVMRIDTARGKTRMLLGSGESIPMKKELCGTYCKVIFSKSVTDFVNIVCENGFAHHVALFYGEYLQIFRKFAKMMNFEVIE